MGQSTVLADTITPSPGKPMTFSISSPGAQSRVTTTSLKRGLTFNFDNFGMEKSKIDNDESPTKKTKGKSKGNTDAGSSSGRGVSTHGSTN